MKNRKPITLLLKDTHLKEDNHKLVEDIFDQAITLCKERGIENISHAGDFFTSRKAQSLAVLTTADRIFRKVRQAGIDMNIIPGNHCKTSLTEESSYLDVFREVVHVISNYECIRLSDINLHFLPYFKEDGGYIDRLLSIIKVLNKKQKNILITHIAISGVANNDGSLVENNLTKDLFEDFDCTYIAHYHDESWIGNKIHYFPANYQANYGETAKKGFTILYDDLSTEFVESKFPKFIKLKLNITDGKAIAAAEKQYKNSDDNVRFVFEGEEAELRNVNKEKLASLGIDVSFNKDSAVPIDNNGLVEKANSVSFDRQGIDKAFETFCEMKHIEDNSIGLKYLKQI